MKRRPFPKPRPPWWNKCRSWCHSVIVPLCCFQALRLLLLPSTLDVLVLGILIGIATVLHFEWI